ncbi:MAG: nitrous oxide reductase family maturation protein NosD [Isosphaeraceae bacterium]
MSTQSAAQGYRTMESGAAGGSDRDPRRPRDRSRRWEIAARLLLLTAAAALLVSPRFPYWTLMLAAPQYPKGLAIAIHPDRVTGDVSEIDGLNHYIGMRKIDEAAGLERRLGIPAIVVMSACLILAAIWPSRWMVLLLVPVILFPPLFLADLYWWLRDSGLSLDPKAAFSSSIKPFVPQVLGAGKIAQFRTFASLGPGYYMATFAALASLFFSCVTLRARGSTRSALPTRTSLAAVAALLFLVRPAGGETIAVEPLHEPGSIARAMALASHGDTILVRGGVHPGPLVVNKSVRLVGEGRPVIDGGGRGTVVKLEAPGCVLRGFAIRSSGDLLDREDVGVLATAADCVIEDNTLEDVLFGIYLRQAPRGIVRGNRLRGKDMPVARRGDLIRLWYSHGATIESNTTEGGRDVVLWYSKDLTIRDNRITGGRYGLHFMYCNDAAVAGNRLADNSVGAFLMYSQRLRLSRNWIAANRGASGYGVGLKDMVDARLESNVLAGNRVGIFLEGSSGGYRDNLLADNDKGIVIFPSATGNAFEGNSFVENGEQVALEGYAGTMTGNLWEGNFWSDYRGYDADGDGRGDMAYRPARLFERLADRKPALRMFAASPSAQAIDFASRVFPIFEPVPKFIDERPMMAPLPVPLHTTEAPGGWPWLTLGMILVGLPIAPAVLRSGAREPARPRDPAGRRPPPELAMGPELAPSSENVAPTAISVAGLTKRFGRMAAVEQLSFRVGRGETVVLWGPNGAGKTTVLRCLLGLLPFEGDLRVMEAPCGPRGRASRAMIGYVPQEVWLHADRSIRETVLFFARLRRVDTARADALIGEWGLKDVEHRAVRNLSGGMKQKLSLVVALLADPPVLLLDEPTSNLDVRTRGEFADLLERLKRAGKTMLFCTHRQSEVWRLADRVVVLKQGRKVAEGTPEQVREHLQEPARLCLTFSADEADAAAARLRSAGYDVQRTGSRVWFDASAERKVAAIELLLRSGFRILDLDLESDRASSAASPTE